jgi:AbiV family abortive infection protein
MTNKIIDAINLTHENAKGLYEEAEILYEHKKFGRAYTLFHLAFEECGRFHMLHTIFLKYISGEIKPKDINYGALKKLGYERHDLKISESFLGIYTIAYINLKKHHENTFASENEFKKISDELLLELENSKKDEAELNRLKNVGLYVTFSENDFHLPDKTITVSQFLKIKKLAELSLHVSDFAMEFFKEKGGLENLRKVYLEELEKNK